MLFQLGGLGKTIGRFPPPYFIPKVLKHLKCSSADETLVVPWWRTALWWPLLILLDNSFRSELVDFLVVEPKVNMFIPSIPGVSMVIDQIQNFLLLL